MSNIAQKAAKVPSPDGAAREPAALEEAFARWQGELLGTLFYVVGNREDARDALQEAFIKCWRHRHTLGEVQNLRAWIFRVALNTGRDLRQTAWRRRRSSLPESDMMVDNSPSAEARLQRREQCELVRRAIAQLRDEEQEVFLLRQNGAMTYDEIAAAVGIPTGTAKTRMRLALEKIRKALA